MGSVTRRRRLAQLQAADDRSIGVLMPRPDMRLLAMLEQPDVPSDVRLITRPQTDRIMPPAKQPMVGRPPGFSRDERFWSPRVDRLVAPAADAGSASTARPVATSSATVIVAFTR